jgi:hypothetical protein
MALYEHCSCWRYCKGSKTASRGWSRAVTLSTAWVTKATNGVQAEPAIPVLFWWNIPVVLPYSKKGKSKTILMGFGLNGDSLTKRTFWSF